MDVKVDGDVLIMMTGTTVYLINQIGKSSPTSGGATLT